MTLFIEQVANFNVNRTYNCMQALCLCTSDCKDHRDYICGLSILVNKISQECSEGIA